MNISIHVCGELGSHHEECLFLQTQPSSLKSTSPNAHSSEYSLLWMVSHMKELIHMTWSGTFDTVNGLKTHDMVWDMWHKWTETHGKDCLWHVKWTDWAIWHRQWQFGISDMNRQTHMTWMVWVTCDMNGLKPCGSLWDSWASVIKTRQKWVTLAYWEVETYGPGQGPVPY